MADMLDKQQTPARSEDRRKIIQDARRIAMQNAVVVPLFNGRKALVTTKDVDGVVIMPVNFYTYFYDASIG
ncbi:MAG: hypothetical protein U0531_11080 [Dehalococcoidia bacterium]